MIDWTQMKTAAQLEAEANPVPAEVPRWAGVLALKRHLLNSGELVLLSPDDALPDANLFALTLQWRSAIPESELADRVDAALIDVNYWERESATVAAVAGALNLSDAQVDELFRWAAEQRA